ncbi:MAG: serine hydrolase domain-containing protein, partial [Saprospiraceae bacterium]|nr:serine hydrolase domain-containing protein [Saprospiraceae bacterium]
SHIVADLISKHTGLPFEDYVKQRLFDPLGITRYSWERDPDGQVWGGFGLQLTARDLAKVGQVYLDQGRWQGSQLVPSDWVERSSVAQIEVPTSNSGYSLQWWISESTGTRIFFGLGFGGQVLMVIPAKDIVIVALQEHLVSFSQSNTQWQNFATRIFGPVFRSVD